jgi:MFS family permease
MNRNDESLVIRNSDLNAAVAAGLIDETTAMQLSEFVATRVMSNDSEDERVRLITGFNDIFVSIGLGLFFSGLAFFAKTYAFILAPLAAWILAEIFTRKMKMALPSIILLLLFAGTIFWAVAFAMSKPPQYSYQWFGDVAPTGFLISALATVAATALHWWRFHVPITIAAGVAALIATLMAAFASIIPNFMGSYSSWVFFPIGLLVFGLAMNLDRKDRARRTQKSDRAFWLHLLAAPLIVHPLVWNMVHFGDASNGAAIFIFVLFAILSLVALTVDRRALLVSSLTYLGYALSTVIGHNSYGEIGAGISVFAVGLIVLVLSVAWKPLRRLIVKSLPTTFQNQIPLPA